MSSPIALTINVRDIAPASLPASLEQRLAGSPTKSPEDLAVALRAHSERTEKLRKAHLDAVRDRASRETQRANEAAARKLRIAASRVDKVQRKLAAAETKTNAKKEASEADREARKARREALALAVAEARRATVEARAIRLAEHKEAEKLASLKHSRAVQEVVDKSASQVKHAIAVVEAHKEKERLATEAAGEKLAERLEKAASNRAVASPRVGSPDNGVRHRVFNDSKVACEMRRLAYEKSMEKAASKRAAILQGVAEKAGAENAKAASVAAATAAKSTDPEAKAALYDRLLRAEVARLSALKNKYLSKQKGDTISVIVVRMEDIKPRMPPPALSLRLSVVPRNLLATSAARQAGAASRRAALRLESQLKAVRASDKRAAALGRVGKVQAAREAAVKARATRSLITYALHQGKRMHAIAQENRRAFEAEARRASAVKSLTALGAAAKVKCDAADERRAAKMRATAKTGVLAIRQAAFKSRREARRAAVVSRGESNTERAAAAATKRAAFLAARVTLAQKHMKAAHPKREMPNMEVTERAAA